MFCLSLARELKMTLVQLLSGMSSQELTLWMAYAEMEAEDMKQHELDARSRSNAQKRMTSV